MSLTVALGVPSTSASCGGDRSYNEPNGTRSQTKAKCRQNSISKAWALMDDEKKAALILNAERLMNDAEFLNKDERTASATALAVLAWEEVGKLILILWDLPAHKGSHLSKQRAVGSLQFAGVLLSKVDEEIEASERLPDEQASRALLAAEESELGRFVYLVDHATLDLMKQLAFYQDDDWETLGLDRKRLDGRTVEAMLRWCRAAISMVEDESVMEIGKSLFEGHTEILKDTQSRLKNLLDHRARFAAGLLGTLPPSDYP